MNRRWRTIWARAGQGRVLRAALSNAGSTAVEFALGIPIFLGLVFGVMEGGRAIFTQSMLFYAAEEAARWAVVNDRDIDGGETINAYELRIENYAKAQMVMISPADVWVLAMAGDAAPPPGGTADNTREVWVLMSYPYDPIMPFVFDGAITLSSGSIGYLAENGLN